jgi:F-type H+-transporting ATPase subunit h
VQLLTITLDTTAGSAELQNPPGIETELHSCTSIKNASVPLDLMPESYSHLAADLIQDLYLKELRAYKPPPQKASDSEGHVQKFTPPAAPQSPEETNLASEMKEYEDQVVEVEGGAVAGETQAAEEDFFEDIDADDEETAHH